MVDYIRIAVPDPSFKDGIDRIGYEIFKGIPSIPISPDHVVHFFMTSLFILERDTLPPENRKLATNVRL